MYCFVRFTKRCVRYVITAVFACVLISCFSSYAWAESANQGNSNLVQPDSNISTQSITTAAGWAECGSCEWHIDWLDDGGHLTIRPKNLSYGQLQEYSWYTIWPWGQNDVVEIEIQGNVRTGKCATYLFSGDKLRRIIGLENLDTSYATDLSYMFYNAQNLTSVDLSSFDTSKVTTSTSMLAGMDSLEMITIGEKFTLFDALPSKRWYNANLQSFSSSSLPVGVKDTYATSPKLLGVPWISIGSATVTGLYSVEYNGTAQTPKPVITVGSTTLAENVDYNLYYSNNTEIGTAEVTIVGKGECFGTVKKTFQITKASIDNAAISGIIDQIYNGAARVQNITVKLNSSLLKKDVDYTVSYSNNVRVGTASVVISGIGKYRGSVTKKYKINPVSIKEASISGLANQSYSGASITPRPIVRYGATTLIEGTDYTLEYRNNTNVGAATVTVRGIGNYCDSKAGTFLIVSSNSGSGSSGLVENSQVVVSGNTGQSSAGNVDSLQRPNNSEASVGAASMTGQTNNGVHLGASTSSLGASASINTSENLNQATSGLEVTGTWKKAGSKWWFSYDSTTNATRNKPWPTNEWVVIAGKRYHFDSKGYMHTKWQKLDNGKWFYFANDGAMRTGWKKVSGKWYYLDPSTGVMKTGKQTIDKKVYFLSGSGSMRIGWIKDSGKWYFCSNSGASKTGWYKSGGKWYYSNENGVMQTGWLTLSNNTYYLSNSGVMQTGWKKISDKWYHFSKSGVMDKTKWVSGTYWVGSDGVMATNSWVDNDRYYVGSNGKWVGARQQVKMTAQKAEEDRQKLLEKQQAQQQEALWFQKQQQRNQLIMSLRSQGYSEYVIQAILAQKGY